MANLRVSELDSIATLPDGTQFLASQPSATVTITATTISFAASDQSINDSGNGFVTAGFVAGDQVQVTGASDSDNNVFSATCTVVAAGKLTTNASTIADESAGATVTVTKWESVRIDKDDLVAELAGTASDVSYTPTALADWSSSDDPGNVDGALDQLAARTAALEAESGVGKHAIWIASGSITPSASGGCAALATVATSSNQPDLQTLNFDATTAEYAQFSVRMPKSWNEGTVTFCPVWSHASTTTNFGVVWGLQGVAMSNDDAIAASYGTAQTSTDTGGTTDDLYVGPESSAITIAGSPVAEDVVFFRVYRDPTAGSDTMAVDARLHGVTLYITTDAGTDA